MPTVNSEIVCIGSELLLGQIVDTNSSWMAQQLAELGVNLYFITSVGDNPKRMKEVLTGALERSNVVITSGGLGPTQDDLTREVVAEVTGRELVLDPGLLEQLQQRFERRGVLLTPNNRRQAYIPAGAIPVENPNGTAPAFIVEDPRGSVICLPGVPFELKWLFTNRVVPYLREKFGLPDVITSRVLKVAELGESRVDHLIGHLIANSSNPTVGVLAHPGQVDVRITAKAPSKEEALRLIAPVEREVRSLLGNNIFATDNQTMENAVGQLLREKKLTVASYEDLTGGMVAGRLQEASREHFAEGIINNTQTSLRHILRFSRRPEDVDELIAKGGEALTQELAWAVKTRSETSLGVAVHLEPEEEQGPENLARGKTYVAVASDKGVRVRQYNFAGRGVPDRTRVSLNALDLLRHVLMEEV